MFEIDSVFDYSYFSDEDIELALREIRDYYKTGILKDGEVRKKANSATESGVYAGSLRYSQALRLAEEYLFQEVANRWIEAKSRLNSIDSAD